MELVVDTLSKKSEDLCQLFILPTFYIPGNPATPCQSRTLSCRAPQLIKDRKSPLPITDVHGCACKEQAVYTAAPPTLQHTSVLSEEDTGRASEESETITVRILHPSANEREGGEGGRNETREFEEAADFEPCLDRS